MAGEIERGGWWQGFGWFLETAGVTAFGFVVMSLISAAVGYLLSGLIWRWWVGRKHRARLERYRSTRAAAE
jgi:uncharacterized protein (DUF2062 family)